MITAEEFEKNRDSLFQTIDNINKLGFLEIDTYIDEFNNVYLLLQSVFGEKTIAKCYSMNECYLIVNSFYTYLSMLKADNNVSKWAQAKLNGEFQ